MAFLTLEDPNAKIKGSRDPLGILPIWSSFGRHVVTNLTTQTTSARGFTILLLGRYFGQRLIDDGTIPREEALDVVLRMEELGAHVRHAAHGVEGDIRGIERVRRFQEEGRGKVEIRTDPRGLILADQKVTGLWGLYSVSARTSGLLPEGPVGVTPKAREFIESHYLPSLDGGLAPLMRILAKGGRQSLKPKDPVFSGLARVLRETFTSSEVTFYSHHLLDGREVTNAPQERQATLRALIENHTDLDNWFNRGEAMKLSRSAESVDEALALSLARIVEIEALLAPANALFDHLLARNGQRPPDLATQLREHWGKRLPNLDPGSFTNLVPEIRDHTSAEMATAIVEVHTALHAGDYEKAIRELLKWNAQVMAGRKAGPWVQMSQDGRLDVRYRGLEHVLPDRAALDALWDNSYFVDSLKSLAHQLQNVA